MITITQDPTNADRLILTQTVSIYLDKLLVTTLSDELVKIIHAQAIKDITSNKSVKRAVADAAQKKLLELLNVKEHSNGENSTNENTTKHS